MELRLYWTIIRRRWWLVAGLPLVVLLVSLALRRPSPSLYQAVMRLTVDVPPLPVHEGMNFDPRFTAAQAAEYLVDDFSELVRSGEFAADVSRRLADKGITVPPGAIQGSTASEKIHRVVTWRVTGTDPEQLQAIAQAAVEALREDSSKYFARLGTADAQVAIIDKPVVSRVGPGLRERLDLPLRILLALMVGLGLAFLLHYLDTTIYTAAEVEELGLAVLGEVPRPARRLWRRPRRSGGSAPDNPLPHPRG